MIWCSLVNNYCTGTCKEHSFLLEVEAAGSRGSSMLSCQTVHHSFPIYHNLTGSRNLNVVLFRFCLFLLNCYSLRYT